MPDSSSPQTCRADIREILVSQLDSDRGCWHGELSSSALATAVAVVALQCSAPDAASEDIQQGLAWLLDNQNQDGGWGDTPESPSNLSTTALCWAALRAVSGKLVKNTAAEAWIEKHVGSLEASRLAEAICQSYGKDRTFAAPILTMCALAGCLGPEPEAWRLVPQLPFQYAALPKSLLRLLRLQVVSYALPALIAVGLVRHQRGPRSIGSSLRTLTSRIVLKTLQKIQPTHGGFLDATPLTGFVALSLAAANLVEHPVTRQCVAFLRDCRRDDGSWPIDSNLDTWLTSLTVAATLRHDRDALDLQAKSRIRDWLLKQQHLKSHHYTGAAPGAWAWTDLPGGVPDADDTAGALIALSLLDPEHSSVRAAARQGVEWLIDLQNHDGGIPTFCRGWGKLPFDQSSPDLSAHALTACTAWLKAMPLSLQTEVRQAMERMLDYLHAKQLPNGTWLPLWFGNQYSRNRQNPVYGTSRVLVALQALEQAKRPMVDGMIQRARTWLATAQNPDGGWGGDRGITSSIEETALAVRALSAGGRDQAEALQNGIEWLLQATLGADQLPATPIGLYFASLWYAEKLYPWIFACDALGAAGVLPNRQPGIETRSYTEDTSMVFSCAGSCDAGCIAERTARMLTVKGLGKMFGLPAIGVNISQVVKPNRNSGMVFAINGCTARCCSERLLAAGIQPDAELVLSELGVKRSGSIDEPLGEVEQRAIEGAQKVLLELQHKAEGDPPQTAGGDVEA